MPTLLEKLKLNELSFVDKGANQHACVTIFKRADNAGSSGEASPDGEQMSGKTDIEKKLEELEAEKGALVEKLAQAENLAKMSDEEKVFVAKMSEEEKKKWAAMTAEEKAKKMKETKKNDETVEVAGQVVSKSAVGDAQFAIFKAQAEQIRKAEERIAKAEEEAALARFEKRAAEEFSHLPGTDAEKAKVLKALHTLDAEVVKTVEAIMKSADEANKTAFEVKGIKKGATVEDSAEAKLEKVAAEIRKVDHKLTKEQALAKAYEAHPELYSEVV